MCSLEHFLGFQINCNLSSITALVVAVIGDRECPALALLKQAWGATTVKDYCASIEKLRKDAAEAAHIRDLATDQTKRDMCDNLHKHFNRLADEIEQAVKSNPAG